MKDTKPLKKLPEAEFDIMKAVWSLETPITASKVMQKLQDKNWVVQSAITLLMRLVGRGFLRTEKNGNERIYYPLVAREDYLSFETGNFIKQYHGNSFINLVNTLDIDKALSDKDIDELVEWVKERKG
ncbi:MAG: BlaI/MecI/CopY family transcriptional regulator [Oscillospiraceae bacterium]|nr:BlaI/MecI/CopY family transcriptional regulator [Oscillospiraceae bacterium]